MICAYIRSEKMQTVLLVLEPGDIERLKRGLPVIKPMNEMGRGLPPIELMLAYTPDAAWIEKQMAGGTPSKLAALLEQSMERMPVLRAHGKSSERAEGNG